MDSIDRRCDQYAMFLKRKNKIHGDLNKLYKS
jgi:hypothetical protein